MHFMKIHIELCSHHLNRQNVINAHALASTAFIPGIQSTLIYFLCLDVKWKMFIYYAVALLLDFGRGAMMDKGKNWATFFCLLPFYLDPMYKTVFLNNIRTRLFCLLYWGQWNLSSTFIHHLWGKLTKQFIVKIIFTVDLIYLKFTELPLITPLFPGNCTPPHEQDSIPAAQSVRK